MTSGTSFDSSDSNLLIVLKKVSYPPFHLDPAPQLEIFAAAFPSYLRPINHLCLLFPRLTLIKNRNIYKTLEHVRLTPNGVLGQKVANGIFFLYFSNLNSINTKTL